MWTPISESFMYNHVRYVRCRCDCGQTKAVHYWNYVNGISTQCKSCATKSRNNLCFNKQGFGLILSNPKERRRLLGRIDAAIRRCHNPTDKRYSDYGGRGITVHEEWRNDRSKFLAYLLTLPGWDDPTLTMDRKDNNKGYEPGNIRFVTQSEQNYNTRRSKKHGTA